VANRRVPWWLRAYLLVGMVQGLAIGLTGLFTPGSVVGFPLDTTPLNTRLVASFYFAGAVGLAVSAVARDAADTRIFVAGFALVTALLLLSTFAYWSEFTANGVPYVWLVSYVADPIIGVAALWALALVRPAEPGTHTLSGCFVALAVVFGFVGLLLLAAPHAAAAHAPWKVTAILARVYAAILLAFALGALLAAFERRSSAVRPYTLSAITLLVLAAIVSLVHRDRFVGGAAAWTWAVALVAGIAVLAVAAAAGPRPPSAA
jgi:hypothetical protein